MAVGDVADYEARLYEHMENKHGELLVRFESGFFEPEDVETLKRALGELR